jgi:hypothetical protein
LIGHVRTRAVAELVGGGLLQQIAARGGQCFGCCTTGCLYAVKSGYNNEREKTD